MTSPFPFAQAKVKPCVSWHPHQSLCSYANATEAPHPLVQCALALSFSLVINGVPWSEVVVGRGFPSFLYLTLLPSLQMLLHRVTQLQHIKIPRMDAARALPQLRHRNSPG